MRQPVDSSTSHHLPPSAPAAAEPIVQSIEQTEDYRRFVQLLPFAVFVQKQGRFAFVNDAAVALFGARTAQDLLGQSVLDRAHPSSRPALQERMRQVRNGARQPPAEFVWLRLDGGIFHGESTPVPCEHDGGPAALVILQDVTARRRAEQQVDRFFNLSLDLLCIAGQDGRFKRVNRAFTEALGWSEAELLARPYLESIHPDDLQATHHAMATLEQGTLVRNFINRYRCKDGSWRHLAWSALPHTDSLIYATARDVTEQREIADEMARLTADLNSRVVERTEALAALSERQEEIRALVDNLPNGVITLDEDGIIRNANRAMERLFGYAAGELIGIGLPVLVPEARYVQLSAFLEHHVLLNRAGTMDIGRELTGRHKAGREIALEFGLSRYEVRGCRHYVATFSDMEERKRLTIELTAARAAAEQSSRAKSAFLATMSHEIRTPMNAVIGMAELLEHTRLDEQQSQLLATIRSSASALLAIIDDILDFSKIEAARLELERGPVAIGDVAEAVCTMFAPIAEKRRVDVGLYVAPDVPQRIIGDEIRLRQVIYNLVGNAIKFSGDRPQLRGKVHVTLEGAAGPPRELRLTVADNGIGISAAGQARLFAAFAQADVSTTRRFGGTGLGLAISRRLVEMMAGRIDVKSAPGEGACFTVTLPIEPDPTAQAPAINLSGVRCQVDLSELVAESVVRYLKAAGANIQTDVTDGSHGAATPLVRLTSNQDAGGRFQLVIRPADRLDHEGEVLPLHSSVVARHALLAAVAVVAGRASRSASRALADARPVIAGTPPSAEVAATLGRLILVAEDDPINQKVIERQLRLLGYAAEVVDTGERALTAWRTGRYALVLTDLQMPDLDGYGLLEAIRNESVNDRHTPVIAITANALGSEAMRARVAGFDGYLTKPVQLATLKSELGAWVPTGADPAAVPVERDVPKATPIIDPAALRTLVGDDPTALAQLYSDFVNLNRRAVADLAAALDERALEQVRSIAHRLKSSSRSVGACRLAESCQTLEQLARAGDGDAARERRAEFEGAFAEAEVEIARLLSQMAGGARGA